MIRWLVTLVVACIAGFVLWAATELGAPKLLTLAVLLGLLIVGGVASYRREE